MKKWICIVIFDQKKKHLLFCKRKKSPYIDLYDFPGGEVETGKPSFSEAYRILKDKTGMGRNTISLYHLMDTTYYLQSFILEIYVGQLNHNMELTDKRNSLFWHSISEDFADQTKYAGEQKIAHIIQIALKHPLKTESGKEIDDSKASVGIDGCRGGWIVTVIQNGKLEIFKYATLNEIVAHVGFDTCLIDMIIGLQDKDSDIRPDTEARSQMKGRSSTIFPSPCRKAVYGETKEKRLEENVKILGKRFTSQTDAIIPKIREVDEFLQENSEYKNKILESHPEVCFAKLNGSVLMTSKHTDEGIQERAYVMSKYLPEISFDYIKELARMNRCNMDDITDSICLAIVSNLFAQGKTKTIPEVPMKDETGIFMQMVVPR